jgi:hypothetical protein
MEFKPLRRVNYFSGRLLTAKDFQDEQDYGIERHRLHNRCLHGAGVICGLEVSVDAAQNRIHVSPGLALDCLGREIVLPEARLLSRPALPLALYLCIRYAERGVDLIPAPGGPAQVGEPVQPGVIESSFEFAFEPSNPFKGHKRRLHMWSACGQDHAVLLKRIR